MPRRSRPPPNFLAENQLQGALGCFSWQGRTPRHWQAVQREHPTNTVFLDPANLFTIVEEGKLGNPKRLPEFVRRLRPDITDTDTLVLFEIKPDTDEGRKERAAQTEEALPREFEFMRRSSWRIHLFVNVFMSLNEGVPEEKYPRAREAFAS